LSGGLGSEGNGGREEVQMYLACATTML
jgi:hypothetical protein